MIAPASEVLPMHERDPRIEAAALQVEPVSPTTTCAKVYERYRRDADLVSIPVVADGRPIGLVNRYDLTMTLAQDYGRPLYAGKPITAQMDPQPLIVESSIRVDALEWMIAANRPSALTRGFIVVRDGWYFGVGTALTLLQLSMSRTDRRARQLEEARMAAEEADRAKSRFLAVMSHELRTPLNAIIGFTDLMKNEVYGAITPNRYRDYLSDVHASGQTLLSLINDILDLSKINAGKMELFEEPIDLEEEINSALRAAAATARSRNITLRSDIPVTISSIYADRRGIRQILLNLLSNAIKFTPAGSIAVTGVAEDNGAVSVVIVDTGIGMSADQIEIALTPFGQIENEYTRSQTGTGLGLPLVKSLAELHDAALVIRSEIGRGTSVTLTFPVSRVLPKLDRAEPKLTPPDRLALTG